MALQQRPGGSVFQIDALVEYLRLVALGRGGRLPERLRMHPGRRLRHVELQHPAHRRKHRQDIVLQEAQVLVRRHERPLVEVRCKDILTVERRIIGEVQQGEERRHQVDLRAELLHAARGDESRRIDQRRNVVLVHGNARLARAGSAVVGHHHEDRLFEPGT